MQFESLCLAHCRCYSELEVVKAPPFQLSDNVGHADEPRVHVLLAKPCDVLSAVNLMTIAAVGDNKRCLFLTSLLFCVIIVRKVLASFFGEHIQEYFHIGEEKMTNLHVGLSRLAVTLEEFAEIVSLCLQP